MKRCAKCNRTYADDGFTFCLEDGALLSAPYDPNKQDPVSTIQSGGPPPTAVLPAESASKETETKSATPPLTITSAASRSGVPDVKQFVPPHFETNAAVNKKSKLSYIIIFSLAMIILFGGIYQYALKKQQCPNIKIVCSQFDPSSAYCTLNSDISTANPEEATGPAICSLHPMLALQVAALPKGVDNVTWSTSLGTIDRPEGGGTSINTVGLSGRTIIVTVRFTADGWICSNTATTSFVAK